MKQILLIGADGQVGKELRRTLGSLGEVVAADRQIIDLTRSDSIRQVIAELKPDLIVNAAAYTAVDKAETEADLARAVNALAPTVIAEEADRLGSALIHISTDYVFDGKKNTPYTEEDTPNPIGIYGQSKLAGEVGIQQVCDRHIILRTAWVYGSYGKSNFVKTMLRLGGEREEIRVVADQIGAPTWAKDIAVAINHFAASFLERPQSHNSLPFALKPTISPGIYHFTNSGTSSWYDFAIAIFEEAKRLNLPLKIQRVLPITTSEYPTAAQRPPYSVLSHQKILNILGDYPPYWRNQLKQMIEELYLYLDAKEASFTNKRGVSKDN